MMGFFDKLRDTDPQGPVSLFLLPCRGRACPARSLPGDSRLPYTSRGAVKTAPYKAPVIVIL